MKALTRKQAAFVKELIDNPKQSAKGAVLAAYGKPGKPVTPRTAETLGSDLMRKPEIMQILHDHAAEAESAVAQVMKQNMSLATNAPNGALALAAARDILDRVHGKATQRMEVQTKAVTIAIDLTGIMLDDQVKE